jgi:hypothetical protein
VDICIVSPVSAAANTTTFVAKLGAEIPEDGAKDADIQMGECHSGTLGKENRQGKVYTLLLHPC